MLFLPKQAPRQAQLWPLMVSHSFYDNARFDGLGAEPFSLIRLLLKMGSFDMCLKS